MKQHLLAGLAVCLSAVAGCAKSGAAPEVFTVECADGGARLDLPGRTVADLVGVQALGELATPTSIGVVGGQVPVDVYDGAVLVSCNVPSRGLAVRVFFSVPAL